ncbi:MAG: cupin domain-containing protein [Eubacteriales bacterium]
MIENKFDYTIGSEKTIEKIILDDNVNINHMILPKGEGLPEHYSNSNVYMIVAKGKVSLVLNDQEHHDHSAGSILNIPFNTKMNVKNNDEEIVELFVVKSPAPHKYQE